MSMVVSLLYDFATRNLHFATNFYHLVAKWRLNDFVNFEPWDSDIYPWGGDFDLTLCISIFQFK